MDAPASFVRRKISSISEMAKKEDDRDYAPTNLASLSPPHRSWASVVRDDFDLMGFMFPAIVGLSVMLAGLTQATRLAGWRAQGVFE